MVQLDRIFESLEKAIEIENQSRRFDELDENELIGKTAIRIMGQMSLLTNDAVHTQVKLVGMLDVDAAVDGGYYGWVGKSSMSFLGLKTWNLTSTRTKFGFQKGQALTRFSPANTYPVFG